VIVKRKPTIKRSGEKGGQKFFLFIASAADPLLANAISDEGNGKVKIKGFVLSRSCFTIESFFFEGASTHKGGSYLLSLFRKNSVYRQSVVCQSSII